MNEVSNETKVGDNVVIPIMCRVVAVGEENDKKIITAIPVQVPAQMTVTVSAAAVAEGDK